MRKHTFVGFEAALPLVCLGLAVGCAADDGTGQRSRGVTGQPDAFGNAPAVAGGAGSSGASGGFGNSSGSAPMLTEPPVPQQVMIQDDDVCDADVYEGKRAQLDIYMMVDDSGSMLPWWVPTLEAINTFFSDPGSAGIGVGLQFFGDQAICDPGFYAQPVVPIAALPGNTQALQAAFPPIPLHNTPTAPALEGAIMHARERATSNPEAKTVVLLVTDGLPRHCGSTVDSVTQIAAEGLAGTPSVQTFVVGIGVDLQAINGFAQAGGTGQAYLVAPGAGAELAAALNAIRDQALPCDFQLPDGGGTRVDPTRVNLRYAPFGAEPQTIGWVPDASRCDATEGGWYYDDPAAPSRLIACEQSCQRLTADGGEVKVLLGCPRVEVPLE